MVALKDMRILITGVQGQVGFELAKILAYSGAQIFLGARRLNGEKLFGLPTVAIDLFQIKALRETLVTLKPHLIINPAAYTAVDKAESEQDLAYLANRDAPAVMAEVLQKLGGGLIHFSTDYVYNPADDKSIHEDDPKHPGNVYAASKWAGEQAISAMDIPSLILRTSWVYGIQGQNFVKTMLRLGREREQLAIVADQFGAPTAATTLAQAVYTILMREPLDPLGYLKAHRGAYNIADQGQTNWHAFALEIFTLARQLNIDLKVERVEPILTAAYKTPAQRPLNSRLNLEKLQKTLGFYPQPWTSMLASFLFQARLSVS